MEKYIRRRCKPSVFRDEKEPPAPRAIDMRTDTALATDRVPTLIERIRAVIFDQNQPEIEGTPQELAERFGYLEPAKVGKNRIQSSGVWHRYRKNQNTQETTHQNIRKQRKLRSSDSTEPTCDGSYFERHCPHWMSYAYTHKTSSAADLGDVQ